jgi:hypothetical protein
MSSNIQDEVKQKILQGIDALILVAEHHKDKHARNGLLAQAASLNNLGERIELHQLPDGFVRSVINDVRLDTLMILTDLKVSLTFQKQELAAPNEKLRVEAHKRWADVDDYSEVPVEAGRLSEIVADLQVLADVEQSLKDGILK